MQHVSIHEAKTHLSRLIKKIEAGEEIVITNNGKSVATLIGPPKPKKRILGDLEGQPYWIGDDFDAPLPEWSFDDPEDPLNKL